MKETYDLTERCLAFAKNVRNVVRGLPKTLSNLEYSKQLIRSSSAIGSNYIEANDALGRKDFYMRVRIARKEAKESAYWLELVETLDTQELKSLLQEAKELKLILSAIAKKSFSDSV